ncbi:tetratricopeptide repeat protein [Halioglobus maricola]|nr:tetratricopeptide repeat protein [Halioglobus maricola]
MQRVVAIACLMLLAACAQQPSTSTGKAGAADFSAPPAAESRFAEALVLMDEQAWEQAALAMASLYEDYPFLSGPALNAALIHSQQGDFAQAEVWFERALQSNPDNADAHNQFAIMLRSQGDFHRAEQHYLAALTAEPDSAVTHYNLGILYDLYLGQKAQALEHFGRYQALNTEEDRQVAGWMADLQRQLHAGGSS